MALSRKYPAVVVDATQKIVKKSLEKYADQEICILQKIVQFMENNPEAEGLLKYLSSVKYDKKKKENKISSKPQEIKDQEGYKTYLESEEDKTGEHAYQLKLSSGGNFVVKNEEKNLTNVPYEERYPYDETKEYLKASSEILDNAGFFAEKENFKLVDLKSKKRVIFAKYCNGGNLKNNLGGLDENEKKIVVKKILTGLAFLHSDQLKIFHSDLKAQNIFLK